MRVGIQPEGRTLQRPFRYFLERLPFLKDKKRRYHDKEKSHRVVPLDVLLQVPGRKTGKNHQRDDLLDGLELCRVEGVAADAVCRDLKTILKERNPPADERDFPQWHILVPKMSVPRKSHEDIGDQQQNNR
jgi:hypothetical protein